MDCYACSKSQKTLNRPTWPTRIENADQLLPKSTRFASYLKAEPSVRGTTKGHADEGMFVNMVNESKTGKIVAGTGKRLAGQELKRTGYNSGHVCGGNRMPFLLPPCT